MNKQEIYKLLKEKNIWFEIAEHKAVFNMEELSKIKLTHKESDAKNLFITDDKQDKYYLITLKGDKRLDLKVFKNKYNTRHLSFAKEEDLFNILKLKPGSVTPLGLLNDEKLKVKFYLDKYFTNESNIIGVHPNDNTATIWLKTSDLINLIKEHGNQVEIIEI